MTLLGQTGWTVPTLQWSVPHRPCFPVLPLRHGHQQLRYSFLPVLNKFHPFINGNGICILHAILDFLISENA